MRTRDFKVALFDLDGTLIATEEQYTRFWEVIGRQYRPDLPDFALRIKGTTLIHMLDTYFDKSQHEEITNAIMDFERNMDFPFVPGAEEMVKDMKRHGIRCAVVTSSDKSKMEALQKKRGDFLALFDLILTAEDFAASKPDPDCYIQGAARFGVAQEECVVFEDAPNGLAAGMASGSFTFGIATDNPREELLPLCHHVLDDFNGIGYNEIVDILSSHNQYNNQQ